MSRKETILEKDDTNSSLEAIIVFSKIQSLYTFFLTKRFYLDLKTLLQFVQTVQFSLSVCSVKVCWCFFQDQQLCR